MTDFRKPVKSLKDSLGKRPTTLKQKRADDFVCSFSLERLANEPIGKS
jgi:hypothetical protein